MTLTVLLLSGCGQQKDDTFLKSSITTPADEKAAALYKNQCISCHAADLSGRVGPDLQKVGASLSKKQLISILEEGANGMPAYKKRLEKEEIEALAEWLAALK
ncbi:cytochrome c [Paenibacillus oralis]|uniref:Cytochrome c n=1 Tax=Paenibacillus oralis TaxID=2490856 RepID=A0A3P3UC28_9BACL|nr:cytochrome c [Paenibacillus oralis]RRJ67912.1 cytochrome c [Paenibacillus oralis]